MNSELYSLNNHEQLYMFIVKLNIDNSCIILMGSPQIDQIKAMD
jgi:hypothetical protein